MEFKFDIMNIKKLWFDDDKIFIMDNNDNILWQSLLWYPRLKLATPEQKESYRFNGFGIRWDDIDEDISFESFDYEEKEPVNEIAYIFRSHPELNVSAVSRRMGIPQSLMAAYINGTKNPSVERKMQILETIKSIGHELISISHV